MKVWFSNLLASLFHFPSPSLLQLSLPSSVSQSLPCPWGLCQSVCNCRVAALDTWLDG